MSLSMPDTPPPSILIYAELLSNIRQVSVGCSLRTPSSSGTTAVVSSDGWRVAISHDGVEQSVPLPGRVKSPLRLPIPSTAAKSLTWRLPLAAASTSTSTSTSTTTTTTNGRSAAEADLDQGVPWSAKDLEPGLSIHCRACKAVIVKPGVLGVWKDLPSENWAEMMEFWHCHKPHDHHKHDGGNLAQRGYGADARISAQPGVGFVDLTSFLLSETDINESTVIHNPISGPDGSREDAARVNSGEVATDSTSEKALALCSACSRPLGFSDSNASSFSLFKWQVNVGQQEPEGPAPGPSLAQCVSAILLATIARTGSSKTILMPLEITHKRPDPETPKSTRDTQTKSLLNIWVFNGNIAFSSTDEANSPVKAVKVLYRFVSQEEADKALESMTSDAQDIALPADAINGVVGILAKSNSLIPESDRHFKDWTVGLVEKWVG